MGIGFTEGLLIAGIALLFFGGKKIPQLGRTLGASIKGFKEGMKHNPEDPQDAAKLAEQLGDQPVDKNDNNKKNS